MVAKVWSGKAVERARAHVRARLPAPCARCGQTVEAGQAWVVGHRKSRASYPELTFEPSNWQVEHRRCSDRSGQAAVIEKAKREALKQAGLDPDDVVFPGQPGAVEPPPFPLSLSGPSAGPFVVPERLIWSSERLSGATWLQPLLDVPDDASPPLAMTGPHPEAVGSYGWQAVEWVEETQKLRLRWWQKLAIVRQLEHREDGTLCWRVIVESGPRRIGKSVRLRGVALWRMEHGQELFGEQQLVIHTGANVAIVREIQMKAWRWAEEGMGWTVRRANGSEGMETPGGDRWLARAMSAVYGYDVTLGMVDEGWDVRPDAVNEGLEPATMERLSPQLHLTSTAHRSATSLMKRRIADALSVDDGETLLMLWAAPPGADPGDPATWRAASAYWSKDRERTLAAKYKKALAGEVDPDADDPDPMEGFKAQYLNVWQLGQRVKTAGTPVALQDDWRALQDDPAGLSVSAVAVEGWPGESVSVAVASRRADGGVIVSVREAPDVATAAQMVLETGCRRPPLVGASMADDRAWGTRRVKSRTGTTRAAVSGLADLLREDVLRHDGGEHLTSQVLALRTAPTSDGRTVRSHERSDAIKAAVWAAQDARVRSVGKPRVIVV